MINSAVQLKAKVHNISQGDNDKSRALIRCFFMEKFLERLSMSDYRDRFILKGGMLTASLIGVNLRATMDIDTTIRAIPLNEDEIRRIIEQICNIHTKETVTFTLERVETIMSDFEYPGLRVYLTGHMDKLKQPFKLDISTDDAITPRAIEYEYRLLLEDRMIPLYSYNPETLLAEKAQTVIARGIANTRMRDFYDIYELTSKNLYSSDVFAAAFKATCEKRDCDLSAERIAEEISNLRDSSEMEAMWLRFCNGNYYVENISWQEAVEAVEKLLSA